MIGGGGVILIDMYALLYLGNSLISEMKQVTLKKP